MASAKKKNTFWTFADRLEGDKVVWIIVLLLILFSIVCMFSSSSRLLRDGMTRIDLVKDQFLIVLAGLALIIVCYNIKNIHFFRWCSQWGFLVSLAMLALLDAHVNLPFLKALNIPSAVYNMLPYIVSLIVLAFTSKKSRAPKAEGIPYDKGMR